MVINHKLGIIIFFNNTSFRKTRLTTAEVGQKHCQEILKIAACDTFPQLIVGKCIVYELFFSA